MIYTSKMIEPLFDLLEPCKSVVESAEHHPEGSVWVHSFQALKLALRETSDTDLILAAWLHDIGKQVHSHGHEKEGVIMLKDHLSVKSLWLIENHMKFWALIKGEMRKLEKTTTLLGHPWLPELVALARWDRMARVKGKLPQISAEDLGIALNNKAAMKFKEKPSGS